jgi:hypothetical protein
MRETLLPQALADIKPEVEATIKMGRRLVETRAVLDPPTTSKNIDSLKELFNLLGSQVRLRFRDLLLSVEKSVVRSLTDQRLNFNLKMSP